MTRPPKADVTMSEKIELRLTASQKEAIKIALQNSTTAGTATVARDLLLRAAADILAVESGNMTADEAGKRYAAFVTSIASAPELPGMSVKMERSKDEE